MSDPLKDYLPSDEEIEKARSEGRHAMEGLVPLAIDLRNSSLSDPVAYRAAAGELLASRSLDPLERNPLRGRQAPDREVCAVGPPLPL